MLGLATVAGAARRPFPTLSHFFDLMALQQSRQRLARLDDHLLRDVGITQAEARHEAERTCWNAPAHWLR